MTTITPPTDISFARYSSPFGALELAASTTGLRAALWIGAGDGCASRATDRPADGDVLLAQTARQLDEYFAGTRIAFDVPLDLHGTPFQLDAWRALAEIPYGTTRSYAEQAARLGRPKASRAVGAANGRNPVSIVLPCHRVLGSDGSLTGFAGGLEAKRSLLEHERTVAAARRPGR